MHEAVSKVATFDDESLRWAVRRGSGSSFGKLNFGTSNFGNDVGGAAESKGSEAKMIAMTLEGGGRASVHGTDTSPIMFEMFEMWRDIVFVLSLVGAERVSVP